ncbi:hypothetical protein OGAPHI_000824 [Ogataea philodendri]|uniref:Protein ECM19 n=1 Tax=Ogataea philodendri TaxID=1378263 RepID=A0A9P8PF30_9ASCO|nr:uncharacterized protein OGAPHI_000824 [Ogataea philodendri]KAH3671113.1 hypothetical protein OGAPHI_000824 [Ogataea philodendri]
MSVNMNKIVTVSVFAAAGVYMGMKFFEPIVIEQLRKDGNLRTDIPVPQYDENGSKLVERGEQVTWEQIRKEAEVPKDSSITNPTEKSN